jgi:hypothetical protein
LTPEPIGGQDRRRRRRHWVLFLAFAAVAVTLRLGIAATTYGTNDMSTWAGFARLLHERGAAALYSLTAADVPEIPSFHYNHPPVSLVVLWLTSGLSGGGVAFPLAFRLLPSLADVVTACLIFLRLGSAATGVAASAVFLFSPLTILISAYHGNTDSLIVCLALAAVLAADDDRPVLAGALIAVACGLKLAAILSVPVVFLTTSRTHRWSAASAFAVVSAVVWMPGLVLAPTTFLQRTLGYAPNGGHFGLNIPLNALVDALPPGHPSWWVARAVRFGFMRSGRVLVVLVMILTCAAYAWQRLRGPALAGFANVVFLAWTSGFGTQYLVWPAANGLFLGVRWAVAYHVAAGVFLCLLYSHLSRGRWWYASFFDNPPWSWPAAVAGIVTWAVLFAWAGGLVAGVARARRRGADHPA